MIKKVIALAALSCLTACERIAERVEIADIKKEQADRQYRDAMAAYSVGDLNKAVTRLKEVCSADPANGSARFQIACILQENEKDYLGAYCAFHEYLQQHPHSDKAKLAESRMASCERAIATVLADKYGLNVSEAQRKETAAVNDKLKKMGTLKDKLAKDVEALMRRVNALNDENARLKALMVERNSSEVEESPQDEIVAAKELIFEDDAAEAVIVKEEIAEAKELIIEDAEETPKEIIDEGKSLLEELAAEQDTPVIAQPADAQAKRKEAEEQKKQRKLAEAAEAAAAAAKLEPRPDFYVVQAGDTLTKLAERFYGRKSVWQKIREANKATISPDGRLKAGQKIVLPYIPE